ncbi:MAG: DUF3883 domain-containing protein [Alphaproteobacteria bacterium]|nr:DUF3883 domain-containing protein [Alphaproteobacteria bacterium]
MQKRDPTGKPWKNDEIDIIVGEYFAMLRLEIQKKSFVKAQINRRIQEIIGRSKGSIEFKNQNISAVLQKLGLPVIRGYVPLENFQKALFDGIERYLEAHDPISLFVEPPVAELAEPESIFFERAPDLLSKNGKTDRHLERLVRKFDPAARDERNRALGQRGEEKVYHFERKRLTDAGYSQLAKRVRWVSQEDGDGAGYDIRSYDYSGRERLLEVKTTVGTQKTPFYLSRNEHDLSMESPDEFRIVRLYDFARTPRAFELAPPLSDVIRLRTENYKASFS